MRETLARIFIGNEPHAERFGVLAELRRAQNSGGPGASPRRRYNSRHRRGCLTMRQKDSRFDIAAVAREPGYALYRVHGSCAHLTHRQHAHRMWYHYDFSLAVVSDAATAGMPSIGAIRATTLPASGAAVKPASAKPKVSFVPCGSSSMTKTR